ncbi:MAG: glycosyltransferase family 4 protein [Anaerolineales bacterium]|nr:glycosyltransferase family 4 protein [Anaerolineales bacterium]
MCFAVAFALVWPVTWLFRQLAPRMGLLDVPNFRSSHTGPIPGAGGIVFVVIVPLVALAVAQRTGVSLERGDWALLVSGWLIAGVSLIDDWRPLPARVRLVAQAWAALGLMLYGRYLRYFGTGGFGVIDVGWLGVVITFVWILGMANAFNFMDGMDGLVAGQGLIAALAVAWLSMRVGLDWMAVMSAALAGGLLGFFLHNRPPARVFMGDVGSIWLGFTFAGLAVLGAPRSGERLSLGFWVLLFGLFLLDSGLTLGRRVLQGEPVLQAHRTHYYQRLLRIGWGHRHVTGLYLLMAIGLGAVAVLHFDIVRLPFVGLVLVGLLMFAGTYALVHYAEGYKAQLESERGRALGEVVGGGLWQPLTRFLRRAGIVLLADSFIVVVAYALAFGLRFSRSMDVAFPFFLGLRDGIIAIVFVHLTVNAALGAYVLRWPRVRAATALRFGAAAAAAGLALTVGEVLLGPMRGIPLSVLGMGAMFSCAGFLGLRHVHAGER